VFSLVLPAFARTALRQGSLNGLTGSRILVTEGRTLFYGRAVISVTGGRLKFFSAKPTDVVGYF